MPPKKRKSSPGPATQPMHTREDWEPAFSVTVGPKIPKKSPSKGRKAIELEKGGFQTYHSEFDKRLDINYRIELDGQVNAWEQMKYYKGFQLSEDITIDKIYNGECICIRGDEEQSATKKKKGASGTEEVDYTWWYAQVLECRAEDPQHVYARIVWLYRPEDLDTGRQPYHGANELIPSNYMQIINCSSVGMKCIVKQWDERSPLNQSKSEASVPMIWRQTVDAYESGNGLSTLETHCICSQPADPDQALLHCSSCNRYLHHDCITQEAIKKTAALGPNLHFKNGTSHIKIKLDEAASETTPTAMPNPITTGAEANDGKLGDLPTSFSTRIYDKLISPFKPRSGESSANPESTTAKTTTHDLPIHAHNTKPSQSKIQAATAEPHCTPSGTSAESPQPATPAVAKRLKKRKREEVSPSQSQSQSQPQPQSQIKASQALPKKKGKLTKVGAATPKTMTKAALAKLSATISGLAGDVEGQKTQKKKLIEVWTSTNVQDERRLVRAMPVRCLFEDCGRDIR